MQGSTTVHDLVVAWAEANLAIPAARQDFIRQSAQSLQRDEDCYFGIGPGITKKQKPYLVYLFARNLFAFTLTKQQANNLEAVDNKMFRTTRLKAGGLPLTIPMPIEISRLEIDGSSRLSGKATVTGRVHYEVAHTLMEPPVATLDFDLKGYCSPTAYFHPGVPLTDAPGVMDFTFPPIETTLLSKKAASYQTTSAAFFRFVVIPNLANLDVQFPISNPLGVLLDIRW